MCFKGEQSCGKCAWCVVRVGQGVLKGASADERAMCNADTLWVALGRAIKKSKAERTFLDSL
jgi:hypothetical protein